MSRMALGPRLAVLFVALTVCMPTGLGIKLSVSPGKTECFTETVEQEHFTVPGGPRIDGRVLVSGNSQYYVPFVTIQVLGPHHEQLWQQQHVYSDAHFNVPAHGPGSYQVCFFNPYDSRTDAIIDLVYFALAHLRSKGGNIQIPKGTEDTRSKEVAHKDQMDEVHRVVLSMNEFVQVIMGSQRYLQRKLDRHHETAVSNKNRTVGYALLEVLVLFGIAGVQIFTITKLFEGGRIHSLRLGV